MEADADARAYDALSQHPRRADLVSVARTVLGAMRDSGSGAPTAERAATDAGLGREDASTPFGNALEVLERGPEDDAERALACALGALVAGDDALATKDDAAKVERLAADLLWLAAHTPFDATGLVDRATGETAPALWRAIVARVQRFDQGKGAALGRGEALVGAMALAGSSSAAARDGVRALAAEVRDPKLRSALVARASLESVEPVTGALVPAPRGPVATALLATTGLLLAGHAVRLLARLALAYRRPTTVTLADDGGLRVTTRTELLGRTLRDREVLVPRAALTRATRDVRYPGLRLYAGLLGLAIGSYVGVGAFVDGVRAASPSLLGAGLVIVALGLTLDFALTSAAPSARGTCRLLFVSRDGVKLCVGSVDAARADALLGRLSARP